MNILPVNQLNKDLNIDAVAVVEKGEKFYHDQLTECADKIALSAQEKPIILLSGPSGSSKTTTAMRLKALLEEKGLSAHVISMDNYFYPLNNLTHEELMKVDLEAPSRVDIPLLDEHLDRFWKCLPTQLPIFNFADQTRAAGEILCRRDKELIIIEGIHALNPEVIGSIRQHAQGVYVSVRTRLSLEDRLLHPSMIRLMRRLMRDRLFRGRRTEDIFLSFRSVQRGEQLYIMPYKDSASVSIDTFISFEAAVYANFLIPELEAVSKDFEMYRKVEEMLYFLKSITPLESSIVPSHSIVREFIGGSSFNY